MRNLRRRLIQGTGPGGEASHAHATPSTCFVAIRAEEVHHLHGHHPILSRPLREPQGSRSRTAACCLQILAGASTATRIPSPIFLASAERPWNLRRPIIRISHSSTLTSLCLASSVLPRSLHRPFAHPALSLSRSERQLGDRDDGKPRPGTARHGQQAAGLGFQHYRQ